MKNKIRCFKYLFIFFSVVAFESCTSPKAYQKIYLNDSEMELAPRKAEKFETNFQVYREGAAGANSGKSGGGCGCN
ncbi:MAG: DUF4266 domain-containing protein [Chitinophagaceae bacterium]|nr:DUF4266 domain-containing protein [Chitinophagaceae bacterium]